MSKSTASATHRFSGGLPPCYNCDVTSSEDFEVAVDAAELGGLDVMVNNAGITAFRGESPRLQPWDESDNSRNNYHGSCRWL